MNPECVAEASARIWAEVEAMPEFAAAGTVLVYASLPDEVPTQAFIEKCSAYKRVVLPVVEGDFLRLRLYDPDKLVNGYMNIKEPSSDAEEIAPSMVELALVPGVAFTRDGARMGRGKGFYDRLLPSLNCPKVGICFPCQLVSEIPLDSWDVPLDTVIC